MYPWIRSCGPGQEPGLPRCPDRADRLGQRGLNSSAPPGGMRMRTRNARLAVVEQSAQHGESCGRGDVRVVEDDRWVAVEPVLDHGDIRARCEDVADRLARSDTISITPGALHRDEPARPVPRRDQRGHPGRPVVDDPLADLPGRRFGSQQRSSDEKPVTGLADGVSRGGWQEWRRTSPPEN